MSLRVTCLIAVLSATLAVRPASTQVKPITPPELLAALAEKPSGPAAAELAERIRAAFSADALQRGDRTHRLDGTLAMWAVESKEGRPRVVPVGNIRSWDLTRIGETDLYAGAAPLPNFTVVPYQYEVSGRRFGGGAVQVEYFPPHPESAARPDVPKGKVTQHRWRSQVFPDTVRDYWVYVPAQHRPEQPAAVMVFQDGQSYLNAGVPTMFDNLIAKGDMPVTVGIFINPGQVEREGRMPRSNRSFEYDTLSDQYARFLRDEILPEVGKTVKLTDDPERRGIVGISSGAIAAWTVAWEMPDLFRKVISHVGSYTNIASGPTLRAGGHNYPALIRKTERKPIRIWLQAGANDLDNEHGNWPLANQEMAKALSFKGYDYHFDMGQGFHSLNHGRATLPDSLRWLWRDVR